MNIAANIAAIADSESEDSEMGRLQGNSKFLFSYQNFHLWKIYSVTLHENIETFLCLIYIFFYFIDFT